MARYVLRRLLYMIPTVGGVMLITFVLFNIVGGSPAVLALGKNASPQALEEFDEQRGFNKPVVFGWWTRTRAYPDTDFRRGMGPWAGVMGAAQIPEAAGGGGLRLTAGEYVVPLAFDLKSETIYRWEMQYRLAPGGHAEWRFEGAAPSATGPLEVAPRWQRAAAQVRTARDVSVQARLVVKSGVLELRTLRLRRRMPRPWDSQLVFYVRQLARLDLGVSLATNQRVTTMLKAGILPSLSLTAPILFVELAVAVSLALICAYFRNSWLDRSLVVTAVVLMSVNYLVWIILGQFVAGYQLGWFPIWGYESWRHLLLPVLIGVTSGLGGNLRFYRTIMLDEMYKDYVRTAFAKGLSLRGVLFRHVLRNALIPVVTNTIIALPFLYTGSLLLESFFGIPGLGGMSVNAINSADVDVVRGVVLIGAVLYVVANLLTDVVYALVDPRVRLR